MNATVEKSHNSKKRPNFLIPGAAKSGTTSLWRYLRPHPKIFMPDNKEPRFFVRDIIRGLNRNDPRHQFENKHTVDSLEDYIGLFSNVKHEKAYGEASTAYLYYYKESIPNIKKHLGDVKIIIILRNPVSRAFSAYSHMLESLWETGSFEDCIAKEDMKLAENWSHIHFCKAAGFYYEQVKAFIENFSEVMVITLDELQEEPVTTIKNLYRFLGVDDSFVPKYPKRKYLKTTLPRSRLVYNFFANKYNGLRKRVADPILEKIIGRNRTLKLFDFLITLNSKKPKPMNESTKIYLKDLYRTDIVKLQDLIGRDLSMWLE